MFYKATKFNGDVSDWDVLARAFCIGVRNNFKTQYGDCSLYAGSNSQYCTDIDDTNTNYANVVCSECGECVDPLIANTSPPTVSQGPTVSPTVSSSPTVTFLPIEGSSCSDTCGSERELMNNNNKIQKQIVKYIKESDSKNLLNILVVLNSVKRTICM